MGMDSMGGTQALNEEAVANATATSGVCPCCDEPWGGLPHAETQAFPGIALRRCLRCGARFSADDGDMPLLVSCTTCSQPFLTPERDNPLGQRCADCHEGRVPVDLPDAQLISAVEQEVCDALDEVWVFAHSPALAAYLNRLARALAVEIDGAPSNPRVAIVDDAAVRTLALPSGLILLSIGALASIEDESELAFVLAHELVHAARGEAALRLVRRGLLNIAREQAAVTGVWRSAVDDTLALGYGRRRELEADERAFDTILKLGYDPYSVRRWLWRIETRISDVDPHLRTYFVSHPTPDQRRSRLQDILAGMVDAPGTRSNREVFRRAAGRAVLASALVRVDRLDDACDVREEPEEDPISTVSPLVWLGLGVALTVAVVVAVLLLT